MWKNAINIKKVRASLFPSIKRVIRSQQEVHRWVEVLLYNVFQWSQQRGFLATLYFQFFQYLQFWGTVDDSILKFWACPYNNNVKKLKTIQRLLNIYMSEIQFVAQSLCFNRNRLVFAYICKSCTLEDVIYNIGFHVCLYSCF